MTKRKSKPTATAQAVAWAATVAQVKGQRKQAQPKHLVDHGTPERQARGVVLDETMAAGVKVARAKIECRLDWYLNRMLITEKQHDAGMSYRSLFERAGQSAGVTGGYEPRITSSSSGYATGHVEARAELREIDRAVGIRHATMLRGVCGEDRWATDVAPKGLAAVPELKAALMSLAIYYRL